MSRLDDKQLRCSFCGKPQDQVRRLIAGPNVFICDECIELCQEIIDEEFIESYPFDALLFKIAKNTILNFTRQRVNRRVFEDHFQLINEIEAEKADDYVIFKETREIIRLIMDDMPPRRREVFMMKKIEGLTRKEISEKLGISIITVDSHLLKANNYLKDELKKYGLLLICLLAG